MKIEKVNDNQIKCTLTAEDLRSRKLKLSELAYGSEKAKGLFRDMMEQASYEFGFEAENIPLMIEAIPIDADNIVLIITKVDDPDEIDTRFSKFAPNISDEDEAGVDDGEDDDEETASSTESVSDTIRELFSKYKKAISDKNNSSAHSASKPSIPEAVLLSSDSLGDLCDFSKIAVSLFKGENTLYKEEKTGKYYLLLSINIDSQKYISRLLQTALEYCKLEKITDAKKAYLAEYMTCILPKNAISELAQI